MKVIKIIITETSSYGSLTELMIKIIKIIIAETFKTIKQISSP